MARKLTEKVSWVGKIDWELKRFHGDEYSTHRGSSYNAYLIRDRKTVLIDTAWLPLIMSLSTTSSGKSISRTSTRSSCSITRWITALRCPP